MQINIKEKKIDDGKFGFFGPTAMLLSPFAKILSGILLIGLLASLGLNAYKLFETKNLEIKLLETQQDNQHLTTENANCKMELDDINLRIATIKADAEQDVNAIKRINEELSMLTVDQKKEINRLLSLPAPKGCESSTDWLRDNLNIFERQQ